MASGFGTYNSTTRLSSAGASVSATVSQSIDYVNRTVTVSLRVTAAYYRYASGSWTPGAGQLIYSAYGTGNYLGGNIDEVTGGYSGQPIGLSTVAGVTYNAGWIYNVQEGYVQARSGFYADYNAVSKTYSFDQYGTAITGSWSARLTLPSVSSVSSIVSGTFTTDSIGPATASPSGALVSQDSNTWNSITLTGSVTSWGTGTDMGRIAVVAFDPSATEQTWTTSPRMVQDTRTWLNQATLTVTNASSSGSGGFAIKGMTPYKIGVWCENNAGSDSDFDNTVRYTPAAPGQLTYIESSTGVYDMEYTGVAANNQTTYDSSSLTRTVRYREQGTSAWTTVVSGVVTPLTDVTQFTVTVGSGETYEVEAWMTYHGINSEVSSTVVTNTTPTHKLYCSWGGETKQLDHLYGSVSGQTKKIRKLYGSVNGVAKLIFEDI